MARSLGYFSVLALAFGLLACSEDESPKNTSAVHEIGKPISIDYDPSIINSFKDTYFDMDLAFYIPPGIEELKNRPLMFTLSTLRNSSVTGSLLAVIERESMIAVSPLNGDYNQFELFFKALIESEYIDPNNVYVAGFSNGGQDIYGLAWAQQDKIRGAILLEPSEIFAGVPPAESTMSICIVCQEDALWTYGGPVAKLKKAGIRAKIIAVTGTDHFGILSSYTEQEKMDCFNFVKNGD